VTTPFAEGTGLGIDDNILDAYTFIMNNYLPDDEIFIFGFSRGAFTARVIAGLIIKLGIFRTNHSWELKEAFKAYRTSEAEWDKYIKLLHENVEKDLEAKKLPRTQAVKIKVVGCWDTVGSVGLPYIKPAYAYATGSSGEYDASLLGGPSAQDFSTMRTPSMRCHLMNAAAHSPRRCGTFLKTQKVVSTRFSLISPISDRVCVPVNLQQCWFPGVHTNVGGGYPDQALADITLAWMIERCQRFLAFHPTYTDLVVELHQHPDRKSTRRETKENTWAKVYGGWGRGWLYDSYGESQYVVQLQGWKYRRPGEYGAKDGASGCSANTKETIHASVRERWNNKGWLKDKKSPAEWRPEALNGLIPRQKASGKWEWVRLDKKGQPVLVIDEDDFKEEKTSFEAQVRYP
jgi:hypothetical protein